MPLSLASLIGLSKDSPLWQWQPDMRYHIIDEGAFPDADVASRDTLAALLFRLENAPDPEQIEAIVDAVINWFRRHDGFEALRPMFATLAHRVVAMTEGTTPGVRVAENLLEVKTMLANRPAEWKQRWTQEGLDKGRREGTVALLTRQLERRFGALPDSVKDRIAAADTPELEEWSLRVLDAGSLDDVLH